MRRALRLLIAAVLGLAPAAAGAAAAGGSEAWELELPRGAIEAVGGAAAAAGVDGAAATTLNPARLAGVERGSLIAGYTRLPLGLSDGHLAGAVNLGGAGTLGGALRVVRAEVNGALEDPAGGFAGPGDTIAAQTIVGSAGWAPDLSGLDGLLPARLRAGAGFDIVRRELAGPAATGAGGGLAVTAEWPAGIAGFAQVRHLGWTDGVSWPLAVVAGGSWTRGGMLLDGDRLRGSIAGVWGRDRGAGGAALVEFGLNGERFGGAVRVGWKIEMVESASLLPAAGVTLRASHLTLDAGWAPLGPFGWTSSLSIGWTSE